MNTQGPCRLLGRSAMRQRWLSAHTSPEGARPGFGIVTGPVTVTVLHPCELTLPCDSHSTAFSVPHSVSLELPWKQGG